MCPENQELGKQLLEPDGLGKCHLLSHWIHSEVVPFDARSRANHPIAHFDNVLLSGAGFTVGHQVSWTKTTDHTQDG